MFVTAIVLSSVLFVASPEVPQFSAPPENMPDTSRWELVAGSFTLTANNAKAWDVPVGKSVLHHGICGVSELPCVFRITYEYHFLYEKGVADPKIIVARYIISHGDRKVETFAYADFGKEPYHYFVNRQEGWEELQANTPDWHLEDDFYVGLLDLDQEMRAPAPQPSHSVTPPKQAEFFL